MKLPRTLLWSVLAAALAAGRALAHDPFEITTTVRLRATTIEIEATMARSTALSVAAGGAEAPTFDPADFARYRPRLLQCAPGLFTLTIDTAALELQRSDARLGIENDVDFHLVFARPAAGGVLLIDAVHVAKLSYGFGAVLTVENEGGGLPVSRLLTPSDHQLAIELPPGGAAPAAAAAAPASVTFTGYLRLGIEHILTGYDHLLFLLGLLAVCQRAGPMLGIITCFTIAHSLTLAVAALGLFSLPGKIVEPLIAASIVYVGLENLARRGEPRGRWALTFVFGLIHGFGFAGVLREVGLGASGSGIALPLFSFNLGVELGQMAVAAVVLPLLWWLHAKPAFVRYGVPAISALVAAAGAFWLVQRTLFA